MTAVGLLHDQAVFRYQPVYSPARQVMGEGQIIKFGIFPAQAEAKPPFPLKLPWHAPMLQPAFERRGAISARKPVHTNPAGTSNANFDLGCLVFKGRAQHC